jgi:5'-nucleotidase
VSDIMLNGAALLPTVTYQVTVNNFLADGNDNFTTFATIDPSLRVGGGVDLDALTDYLGSDTAGIAPPGTDRVKELS